MTLTECPCGSGEYPYDLLDKRGIYCGKACTKCEPKKTSHYREEIFTNRNYEADEPIEPEEW